MNRPIVSNCRFARFVQVAVALAGIGCAVSPALAQQTQPAVPTFQTQPVAPAQPTQPQPSGSASGAAIPVVVGILDTATVLNQSSAGKSLNAQWDAAVKALNADMDKKEGALRAQAQQLEMQRSGNPPMAPADYDAKRKAIEAQDAQYQQAYNSGRQALEAQRQKATETVANAARKAMQDAAKAHGLTLIIDRSAAPYSPQPWNITEEVMQRLNKILPNIKL